MYKAHYINPLIQNEKIEFTLLIEDDENILPSYRIDRSFDSSISTEELNNLANEEILRILEEQNLSIVIDSVVSVIDLPANIELNE